MQDKKWRSVFTTEFLDTTCDGTHFVALSNVSNELLIIYYFRGRVADMSKELPTVFRITQTKDPGSSSEMDLYKDIIILEGKDRLFCY